MPTRRVRTAVDGEDADTPPAPGGELIPTGEVGEIDVIDDEEILVDRVRRTLQSAGDGVTLKLYRAVPNSRKLQFCALYPADDLESIEERVQAEWGAGSYELRLINSQGIRGRFPIDVAAPIGGAVRADSALLAKIEELSARVNPAAPPVAPEDAMMKALGMLRMLREVMPAPAPAPVVAPQSPMEMMQTMMAMMTTMKQFAAEMAPPAPASDPDDPVSMLGKVVDVIGAAVNRNPATPAASTIQPVALPSAFAAPSQPEEPDDMATMQSHIAALEAMAQRNASTDDGAAYLYQYLPGALVPMVKSAAWQVMLSSLSPTLAGHAAWCAEVRSKFLSLIEANPGDFSDTTPPHAG